MLFIDKYFKVFKVALHARVQNPYAKFHHFRGLKSVELMFYCCKMWQHIANYYICSINAYYPA